MVLSRGLQKFERVTITLVPTADEASFRNVPSTFDVHERAYAWRQFHKVGYMIVPTKITSREIKVDIFIEPAKGPRSASGTQKLVEGFVKAKIETEWRGLKLGSIGKPTVAPPPEEKLKRGTIEEMLGAILDS